MKKILLISIVFLFPVVTFAATKTATPSSTLKPQSKIDDLKERLATKVAELRKSSPKAISGTVTQKSISSITVDTVEKAVKIELTDDIQVTQILKGKRSVLSTDDIDKNDIVTVFGQHDETLDVLQATNIFIEPTTSPIRLHGTIATIDKKTNSFTVTGVDDTRYTIDVESTTKNNSWTNDGGIEKSGFSKLEPDTFVTIVGIINPKKADHYTATRILSIKAERAAESQDQISPTETPEITAKPTGKSTPTAKSTPKNTVAPTKKPTATPGN